MIGPDHWSFSSAKKYGECPRSWAAHYLEGLRSRPGPALIKGKAVDKVATANWDQKRKTGKDIAITDADEMAEAFYREMVDEVGGRSEVEWKTDNFTSAMESTLRLTEAHMVAHAPLYTPLETQKKVVRQIEGSARYFLGFIDAMVLVDHLVDVKTGTRKMTDQDTDGQATAYAYALNRPVKFEYLRLIDTGKSPVRTERIETYRGQAAIDWYTEFLSNVDRGIDAGVFPTTPGFFCGWCPLKDRCIARLVEA